MIADGRQDQLAISDKVMDETNKEHFSRVSVEELQGIFDTMNNIEHMGRFKNDLIKKGKKRKISASAGNIAADVAKKWGSR